MSQAKIDAPAGEAARKVVMRQPISKAELERRWKAVRTEMTKAKLDALITHSTGRFHGGMVRYFTDVQMSMYGGLLVFPLEGEMTLMTSGAPSETQHPLSFNLKNISRPFIPSMDNVKDWYPEGAVAALKQAKAKRVGVVEKALFPLSMFEYIKQNMPDVTFTDATEMVEAIRAVKSPEEIELQRKTCQLQDNAMYAVQSMFRPGVREYEIMSEVKRICTNMGSEEQLVLIGTGPAGATSVSLKYEWMQNRVIQDGDYMAILIETNGPGGLWTELARVFVSVMSRRIWLRPGKMRLFCRKN